MHRAVFSRGFVVDRHALAFHLGLQDRYQRGAVAPHSDWLLDAVFEKLAHLASAGRGLDARFAAGDGPADAGAGGRDRIVGRAEILSSTELLLNELLLRRFRRRPSPSSGCVGDTPQLFKLSGQAASATLGLSEAIFVALGAANFARLVNLWTEVQILRDRHDRAIAIKRILDRLNERNRSAGNQRQRNVLPVFFADVVDDGPALEERAALRIEHDPIGRLPDRSGDRITDDHFALAIPFGRYGNGLRVAASRGGRGARELSDVLPRAFVQQFDRAHVIQVEALQFARVGRDHQRVSFDRRFVFFGRKLAFADGENGPGQAAVGRRDRHARALQLLQDPGQPAGRVAVSRSVNRKRNLFEPSGRRRGRVVADGPHAAPAQI